MFNWLFNFPQAFAEEAPAAAAQATAGAQAAAEQPGALAALISTLLPMVLIMGVFYFLMIRPQRKKDKKVKEMLDNLKVGDRICTIGGIYGTIAAIKDQTLTIKVGKDGLNMYITRWAVRNVEEISVENEGDIIA